MCIPVLVSVDECTRVCECMFSFTTEREKKRTKKLKCAFLLFQVGLVANFASIGILATKDMRKHTFNQLLIALAVFDILFIMVR